MSEARSDALRPRERILLAARDLFHRHGIRGVGVETIAEAAGTNKMTLYRHFDSKDDLIVAYLRGVAAEVDEMWRDFERDHPGDMQAQLKAWLICAEECVTSDERGCDLANAAVELTADDHPGRRIIEELKTEHRNRLASLCRRAGISQPEVLADILNLGMWAWCWRRASLSRPWPCSRPREALPNSFSPVGPQLGSTLPSENPEG